jgi:hypothetical protein
MRADVKARRVRPVQGKPSWHALYLDGGVWRLVRNSAGLVIEYASERAAIDAAIYSATG